MVPIQLTRGERTLNSQREQLRTIVRSEGLTELPELVQLASGEMSRYFIDGKAALRRGSDLRLACEAVVEVAASNGIAWDAVGGLTMGADHFSHGIALLVGDREWFSVRKERKGRGTNKLIEGSSPGVGCRVLLVDDVVTTGKSIQQAHAAVAEAGAEVALAVTLVDRGEVASAFFAAKGVPYFPLLTYTDLEIPAVGAEGFAVSPH